MNWMVEDNALVTPENALEFSDYVRQYFPNGKLSWMYVGNTSSESNYAGLRTQINEFITDYGDDVGIGMGFPAIDYDYGSFQIYVNNLKTNIHNNHGFYPTTATGWAFSAKQLEYLKSQGVDVVMGQAWSQMGVDRYSGSGGIPYPYYPSKRHHLCPAQDDTDSIGLLLLDTNTPEVGS